MIRTDNRSNCIKYNAQNMITIAEMPQIHQDERGSTYYFDTDRTEQFVVAYRKAGTYNARHYHKPMEDNKNPEIFLLLSGEISIKWFDVNNPERKGECTAKAPVMITVQAMAWHEVYAETDFLILELNTVQDGKTNSFRLEQ